MSIYDPDQVRNERLALEELRQHDRKSKPLWQRLHEVMDNALLLSTVPSAGISEYTTKGKAEGSAPPQQQTIETKDHLALIEYAIELLEEAVDGERGLSPAREFKTMRTDELDQELLKWRGVASFVVAVKAPWLGRTPRTIERARQRLNVRQSDGETLPPKVEKYAA